MDYFVNALSRHSVLPGDLLIAGLGDDNNLVGRACVAPDDLGPALVKADCFRFRLDPMKADARFVAYSLSASADKASGELSGGSTRSRINLGLMAGRKVWLPPHAEQVRIANFLDAQTARIDALIAEKEKLLVATREYFTARLGTAVVLGQRRNRRYVEAVAKGFESVPEDWGLVPLKHLATSSGGMTPSKERQDLWVGDIPWVSPKDMKRFVLYDSADHISQAALDSTSLKLNPVDSVLVVVRGMILAHTFPVALNAIPVTINQDMKALRANPRVSPKYLAWMLRGLQPLMLSLTEESAHGTKALRTDQWANQCVPVPPPAEQLSLVAAFENWESESASLAAHLETHIDRLREYRSSLISAAVTGQLDISTVKVAA